ncbi:MAG: alpha/beta fold hydrolase [Ilumatobacteraceae bacterium]
MTERAAVPIVLIHGVGLDHTMWLPVMAALSHRRTIAYDMVGHGHATKPEGPYTLATFVDQLSEIVGALRGDVELVGFSMGALVAEAFAASAQRSRVRRMVLLNAVHDRSPAEREAILDRVTEVRAGRFESTVEPALQRWFSPDFATAYPGTVADVRRRLLENDVRAYGDAYEVFATADAELARRVDAIDVPTLVVTGSDDQRSTPAMSTALAAALPNGRAMILPGLRHLTPVEAPITVANVIDEFTRR